jgi:diguanylate cyclase (GGDEF)-like protein/PAS domain S-box-containing protein
MRPRFSARWSMFKSLTAKPDLRANVAQSYLVALALLAGLILFAASEAKSVFRDHASLAEVLDTAGAQRMLSQRVTLLAGVIASARDPDQRAVALSSLRIATARMRAGHARLTAPSAGPVPAQSTVELRVWYSPQGADLDARTTAFIADAERLMAEPHSAKAIAAELAGAHEFLLRDLDRAVTFYRANLRAQEDDDQAHYDIIVFITLLALLGVALFVVRPLAKQAGASYGRVNKELAQRTQLLSQVMSATRMGHYRITKDRPEEMWVSRELIALQRLTLEEGYHPVAMVMAQSEPKVADLQRETLARVLADGETREVRITLGRADHVRLEFSVVMTALRDEAGEIMGVCGVQRDITEETRLGLVLDRQRGDLSEAQSLARIGGWRWVMAEDEVRMSAQARALLGWGEGLGVIGREAALDMYHPDDRALVAQMNHQLIKFGEAPAFEARIRRGDGDYAEVVVRSKAERNGAGALISVFGTYQDISHTKHIERELEARRSDLLEAQTLARMASWRWRIEGQQVDISEEAYALLGYAKENFPNTVQGTLSLYLHDGAAHVQTALQELIKRGVCDPMEVQMRRGDGSVADMILRVKLEYNREGRPYAVFGSFQDISEGKTAERALERSREDLFESQILGRIASWRYRVDAKTVEWNAQTYRLFGYDPAVFSPTIEALRGLYLDQGSEKIRAMVQKTIATGACELLEVQVRRGDGTVADVVVHAKLETSATGEPLSIFGTFQDISDAKAAERELEQLAYFDHLTGLANRALFKRELKKACERPLGETRNAALLLLDVDQFKDVNDGLGHAAGDALLQVVAKRLAALSGSDQLIARLGGDEFAVLVHAGDACDLDKLAGELIATLSQSATLERGEVSVSASIGIVRIPEDASDPEEAMRCADLALYAAKQAGRARALRFQPSMSAVMQARLSLARDMRQALERQDFKAHYQPLFDLSKNCVSGFEALVRWRHPTRGMVAPADFIPIAESSHFIAELGAYMLNVACTEAKAWVDAGIAPREVAVNVSAAQVWHGDLEATIAQALEVSGLDPKLLCIELTESVFAAEALARLEGILTRLKARGVRLALDDFGAGYSSLGYLNRLPFDKLKIDRCFVAGVNLAPNRLRLLRGIVELGHGLGMQVVAEGVETAGELAVVRDLGCDYVQGWFFAKALPGEEAVVEAARLEAKAKLGPLLLAADGGFLQVGEAAAKTQTERALRA